MKAWVFGIKFLLNKLAFTYCFDWELLWNDLTMVNKFSADNKLEYVLAMSFLQWNSKHPSQLNHVVIQLKSPKTCTNQGPETNFPEIFDDLFTLEKIHMTSWQIFYDKWNWRVSLISKDVCNKKCDKIYSSTRANTVCNSISSLHGALGSTSSQEGISISQYTKLLESIQL